MDSAWTVRRGPLMHIIIPWKGALRAIFSASYSMQHNKQWMTAIVYDSRGSSTWINIRIHGCSIISAASTMICRFECIRLTLIITWTYSQGACVAYSLVFYIVYTVQEANISVIRHQSSISYRNTSVWMVQGVRYSCAQNSVPYGQDMLFEIYSLVLHEIPIASHPSNQ
jgi:hypothetical protein